jgi:hypothetical protein
MNLIRQRKNTRMSWAILPILLIISAMALAQAPNDKNKKSTPPPPAPAKPAAQNPHGPASPQSGNAAPGANTGHPANTTHGANGAPGPNGAHGPSTGRPGSPAPGTGGAHGSNAPGNAAHGGNANAPGNAAHGGNANASKGAPGANAGRPAAANRRGPPTTTREITSKSGAKIQASYRGGHVRTIQTHNMRIDHKAHGERKVVSQRNGRQVVATGRGRGYMQRPYYSHGGRTYVQRTYYVGGRPYVYAYRTYYYGGQPYYGYAPAYYYQPVYYGWAYNPWPAPVYYNWGWNAQPWYGYYGPYYSPYPSYPTASFWLTDYLMAESLRAAYEAQQAGSLGAPGLPGVAPDSANAMASLWSTDDLIATNLMAAYGVQPYAMTGGTTQAAGKAPTAQTQISPEVKQAIADELKKQIAAEQAAASNSQQAAASGEEVPPALDPNSRIFVVSSNLDSTTSEGQDCSLTPGDVILRTGDTPDDDHNVDATVKSSKKDECPVGSTIAVDVSDLQEMHNHLRETLDAGLKTLAENSGKNGLPAAPDTTTKGGEVPPPAADTNVDSELQQAQKDADQAEADVPQESGGQGSSQ